MSNDYSDISFGLAVRNGRRAAAAAEATVGLATALSNGIDNIQRLKARIAELEAQSAVTEMTTAGLEAQRDAYMAQHANSPLLQDSGKRFKDGDPKTKARLIFEAAFDAKGRELKIENPAEWRQD